MHRPMYTRLKEDITNNTVVKIVSCIVPFTLVSIGQHCRQSRLLYRPIDTRLNRKTLSPKSSLVSSLRHSSQRSKKDIANNTVVKIVSCIVPLTFVSNIIKGYLEPHCRQSHLVHRPIDTRLNRTTLPTKSSLVLSH